MCGFKVKNCDLKSKSAEAQLALQHLSTFRT
jgi:hypothetical protein